MHALTPQQKRDRRDRMMYHVRNTPAHIRSIPALAIAAVAKRFGVAVLVPTLRARINRADGSVLDLGIISRRVITTAGVNFLASTFLNTAEPEVFNFHDSGTGVGAEAVGNTGLGTATGNARVTGTQTNSSANVYQTVATLPYAGTFAITEHGIFSASTVGTLLDRSVFTAINVVSGDSITFTYQLTLPSGG